MLAKGSELYGGAGNVAVAKDGLDLLSKIGSQGFVLKDSLQINGWPVGGTVTGSIAGNNTFAAGSATVLIATRFMYGSRAATIAMWQANYVNTAIHEMLHLAGRYSGYDDTQLATAASKLPGAGAGLPAPPKNPFVSANALDLFDSVRHAKKGGFVRGGLADKNRVSATVSGQIRSDDAAIHLNSNFDGSFDPQVEAKAIIAIDAFNTLHELVHHAGSKRYYDDIQIAETLSKWLGVPGLPTRKNGESKWDFIGRNSSYFSSVLREKCPTLNVVGGQLR